MKLIPAILLAALAACSSPPRSQSDYVAGLPLTIDQPAPPYPYNSRICP